MTKVPLDSIRFTAILGQHITLAIIKRRDWVILSRLHIPAVTTAALHLFSRSADAAVSRATKAELHAVSIVKLGAHRFSA